MTATPAAHRGELRGASGNRLAWEAFDGVGAMSVVFAHGGGQSRHAWRRAALELQREGYPSLIFDQRGHGDSEWSAEGHYHLEDFQADLERILGHWARPCVLVGASLGGLVSLMAAAGASPDVRGLVMIDTAPQLNPAEIDRLLSFLGGAGDEGFESPQAAADHVRAFFPARAVSAEAIEPGLMRTERGRWHWRWDVRVVLGERNSVALPHEVHLHECASRIQVPFLLVRAGHSELVSDAAVERLRGCAPQLEVLWLPDADHLVGASDGPRVARLIEPFLARCAGGLHP